jgi:hypothetical protein
VSVIKARQVLPAGLSVSDGTAGCLDPRDHWHPVMSGAALSAMIMSVISRALRDPDWCFIIS